LHWLHQITMFKKLRQIPPVSLVISLVGLLTGKLRYSNKFLAKSVKMVDGKEFTIFRHITSYPLRQSTANCVFIVSFKFAHLSYKANKIASLIPMLLISGFPGFISKLYAVHPESGYWQGMYQWKSKEDLEEYKNSFVYRMMNNRAIADSIKSYEVMNQKLSDVIEDAGLYLNHEIN